MFLAFALSVLAAYRITIMVRGDTGPFSLFAKLRAKAFQTKISWVQEGLSCPGCISFYVGFLLGLPVVISLGPEWYFLIIWPLAISGAVVILFRYFGPQ